MQRSTISKILVFIIVLSIMQDRKRLIAVSVFFL